MAVRAAGEATIGDQLRDGIRGLLIDAHYGRRTTSGRIETDLSDAGTASAVREEVGKDAFEAALRIRERIVGTATGKREVYLCHGFCELGAISLDKGLAEIRDFVAANPAEVVTVVIEDYVDPADIAAAFERTGLIDYVYEGELGEPFPTLSEMIDSGGRVVVMAENDAGGGAYPWFHQVYDSLVQETPYRFEEPRKLTDEKELEESCEANRGPDDAPLFLINHWVDTSPAPRPSNAAKVNKPEVLERRIERARSCAASRPT